MTKKQKPTPPQTISKMLGTYDGAELRSYTTRPNAMDAFTKPSVINGERQNHKPMAYMTSKILTPFYTN